MKQHEKIKNPFDFAQGKQISKIFEFLFIVLIFIFLFLNLAYSQYISPLYSKITSNDRSAIITFLQKIKSLPDYQNILVMNDNNYGQTIKTEIYADENKKKEMINNLEQQLAINPKARDILYSLYQLYLAEGNKNKANDYLRRAKAVDPVLK